MQLSELEKTRKNLGHRVRTLRKEQGLSQEKLGEIADLHRAYIGAVERGEQNVSINNIAKIAWALRLDISALFKI